jgi:hypothetical protein
MAPCAWRAFGVSSCQFLDASYATVNWQYKCSSATGLGQHGMRWLCRRAVRQQVAEAEYGIRLSNIRAVLPLPSAPEGRGADGVDAMA